MKHKETKIGICVHAERDLPTNFLHERMTVRSTNKPMDVPDIRLTRKSPAGVERSETPVW